MDISGNSLNQTVNFYLKNTENSINRNMGNSSAITPPNTYVDEFTKRNNNITPPFITAKKRKSKRLNTFDTEFLPDIDDESDELNNNDNIFKNDKNENISGNIKKVIKYCKTSIPIVNYGFLKHRQQQMQKTIDSLTGISQNIDELMNSAIPYGEGQKLYQELAKNLTNAANIIDKSNKNT